MSSILMKEAPGRNGLFSSNKKRYLGFLYSNMTVVRFCIG